jgi:hypothetical protein
MTCPSIFTLQVLALCAYPALLDNPGVKSMFAPDAIERARKTLKWFQGGVGAYTDSRGNPHVREEVAKFIEKRDGVPSNPEVGGSGVCSGSVGTPCESVCRPAQGWRVLQWSVGPASGVCG